MLTHGQHVGRQVLYFRTRHQVDGNCMISINEGARMGVSDRTEQQGKGEGRKAARSAAVGRCLCSRARRDSPSGALKSSCSSQKASCYA